MRRPLAARELIERREAWHTLDQLISAQLELMDAARVNDDLRHALRLPKGMFAWLKTWSGEVIPILRYARHLNLPETTQIFLTRPGTQATDILLAHPLSAPEKIEVTVAYADRCDGGELLGNTNPGYQEALRFEKLNKEGFVSASSPMRRNPKTGISEEVGEDTCSSCEQELDEWARGVGKALEGKQRPNDYGRGSTLLVYGHGMSGDFEHRPEFTIEDIIVRIPSTCVENSFDRTVLISWHDGWIRELPVTRTS